MREVTTKNVFRNVRVSRPYLTECGLSFVTNEIMSSTYYIVLCKRNFREYIKLRRILRQLVWIINAWTNFIIIGIYFLRNDNIRCAIWKNMMSGTVWNNTELWRLKFTWRMTFFSAFSCSKTQVYVVVYQLYCIDTNSKYHIMYSYVLISEFYCFN